MAPTRKSRSVSKRISNSSDVSPEKDGVNSNKNKHRVCHDQMVFILKLEAVGHIN